jgi:UDP-N-acetylmuramoyl-L-alanyl-D-glutamate--2,6-diaminopimelate ligase
MPAGSGIPVADLAAAIPSGGRLAAGVTSSTSDLPAAEVRVLDVVHDSRQVAPGVLFACLVGEHDDGHRFAESAVAAGAVALLVERELPVAVPQIVVDDARRALGHLAAAVHDHPSTALTTVGITGTNGKTTSAHLLAAALTGTGVEVGVLGTLSGARTTPEAPDLQRHLAGFRDAGLGAVVMEVSSHALALHRVDGTRFDVAVFTNLGRDHLDLHHSIEEYFRAKARLFTPELASMGVVNRDDPYGRLLLDVGGIPMRTFGLDDAVDASATADGHRFRWRGREVIVPIGGDVNLPNSLAVLATCEALDLDLDAAVAGLASAGPVPGRFELVGADLDLGFAVVVDYAHTPDGLDVLLASARRLAADGRVIVVVGCGGDRDRDKRRHMGAAAAEGADVVVITSDNPRSESPDAIIEEVLDGVAPRYRGHLVVEADRRAAIGRALDEARHGDVVVIAGKGHETTQTIGTTAHPFDDRVVAREFLEGRS